MKSFSECNGCQKRAVVLVFGFALIGVYASVRKVITIVKNYKNENI
ncbi:hypothetical protein [Chryseobacterium defluvii]|uniref:Uncharacterized protein n=1 Tax=Chryseobacterium defluvii TaxID=160396 RepID=A0A495SDD0_9FLAO|nr:hypothetical protein [Chryseobacterium defluvii]RKS98232.1 hypothetical protein BCF58_2373 [Chryseobacterium defluvii]